MYNVSFQIYKNLGFRTLNLKTFNFFNRFILSTKRLNSTQPSSTHTVNIPSVPSIHDPEVVRRPGEIIDISTLTRNYWSFPAVGFNSVLELPVYVFEYYDRKDVKEAIRYLRVPNDIFGLPLRPDILHRCYQFYRRAKAGYSEDMQLYKWEWPGSTKKWRKQQKTGKARIGWKKSPGKYMGVFAHPLRPHDNRTKIQRRTLYTGLKIMLSAKFAQSQIQVVDSFLMASHKTKYAVQNLRRILGDRCNSALLVFEGVSDSNENFRWSTANIPSVRRETVEGVNVYNLLKYRQLVITQAALKKLIYYIENYPKKCDWLPKYATPNNTPAPIPEKVKGWNSTWIENKLKARLSPESKEKWMEQVKNWKWSSSTKGPLKVPRDDPLKCFRLIDIPTSDYSEIKNRFQYLYDSAFDSPEEAELDPFEPTDDEDKALVQFTNEYIE
ncbi:Ribosomal protein L4/L1 family protein [Theileria parva strain Muguga]|uniref:Ribosomal protein L4/L1 family protein n=1 Tax=Theileria parva strain Muguga TaxID=333668 RepID=UPI001C624132|nr:Ribosomal protein L4/L1 family protein [Theileria parva strain Muguga]EAN34130.2 Ribosomal protein L4/L1 family protein [Theileria parva strain Muguga]